jgi:hypothetical protein
MQDRQMVFPRFRRKFSSPLLIPRMKSKVKIMMSQTAFLGIPLPPEKPAACQGTAGNDLPNSLLHYKHRSGRRGKFFPGRDTFLKISLWEALIFDGKSAFLVVGPKR